ncbi:hypothetical protein DL769_010257 [Monosporascus sp. CRB-8-3]|nr:hypothetical protein DL769_010257 [Monosporascus sp. CRB-8-3]
MDAWRFGINKLRARLPEDAREMRDRAEEDKNFKSPECEAAVKNILHEATQPLETIAACGGLSCPRLGREGYNHLPYNVRRVRYVDPPRAERTMR